MDWTVTKYAYEPESEVNVESNIPQGWTRKMYHLYNTDQLDSDKTCLWAGK